MQCEYIASVLKLGVFISVPLISLLVNESLYPSTYIFGGPEKILLRSNISVTNTGTRHYYLDCNCNSGKQNVDAFSFLDQIGRDFTYHIRYMLMLQFVSILFLYYFDAYIKKFLFVVEIFSYWILFASVFIISIQDTSCAREFDCENSVWTRSMWGWLLLTLQCLFVAYIEFFWRDTIIKELKQSLKGFKLLV